MKKIGLVVLLIVVLAGAGAAFAVTHAHKASARWLAIAPGGYVDLCDVEIVTQPGAAVYAYTTSRIMRVADTSLSAGDVTALVDAASC